MDPEGKGSSVAIRGRQDAERLRVKTTGTDCPQGHKHEQRPEVWGKTHQHARRTKQDKAHPKNEAPLPSQVCQQSGGDV